MDNKENLFEGKNNAANGDVVPQGRSTDDDVLIDEIFSSQNNRPRRPSEANEAKVQRQNPAAGDVRREGGKNPQPPVFTKEDVDEAAAALGRLMDAGKLERALDLAFTLKGALRVAVKDVAVITVPVGSHDNELRQIAAGALIQSYLEQGKIVRRDIEDKLFAIIESSEPEYDEDDEIIEQSPEEILYKVTVCMIFAGLLCEGCGRHPNEKSAMYEAGDSVLDSFLADNLDAVMRRNKRRMMILSEAIKLQGGFVGTKLASYVEESRKNTESVILKFLGEKTSFRVAAGILLGLCLISVFVYLFNRSSLFSFVATDNAVMLFIIGAEIFFTVGMILLAVLIGFGKPKTKPQSRETRNPGGR